MGHIRDMAVKRADHLQFETVELRSQAEILNKLLVTAGLQGSMEQQVGEYWTFYELIRHSFIQELIITLSENQEIISKYLVMVLIIVNMMFYQNRPKKQNQFFQRLPNQLLIEEK